MAVKPARLREIAQAIADDLNLATQPWHGIYTFTATRSYWTIYGSKDVDPASGGALRVDVMLGLQDWHEESRAQEEGTYGFGLVIQQKVDRTNTGAVDALVDLVAAIADSFKIGFTFVPAWNGATTYALGAFALTGDTTYHSLQANNLNHPTSDGAWWESVNPIELLEKHNPIVYSPKEGDTNNRFMAEIDLVFRHDK